MKQRERDATRLGCQFRAGLMASLHMIKSRLATTASEPMSTRYESADEFSLVEEPFIPGGYPLFSASALPHHSSSLKSLLPRLWDILSSPSRSPPRPDPQSWYQNQSHSSLFSRNGSPSFSKKQKHRKVPSDLNFSTKSTKSKPKKSEETQTLDPENESEIDYTTLPPLDGEEGELIDDEACYFVGFGYSKFTNEEVQDGVKDKEKESRVPTLGRLAFSKTRNTLLNFFQTYSQTSHKNYQSTS